MSLLCKILGLPEKDDGVFTIPIPKKIMIQHGWDIKEGQVSLDISKDKIVITKI